MRRWEGFELKWGENYFERCHKWGLVPDCNVLTSEPPLSAKKEHNLDIQEISLTNAKRLLCNPGNCWLAAIVLLAAELVLNTVMIVVKLGPKVIE